MPCWDRGTASREDLTMSIRDNPGPQIHRRCTDPLWCLLLLAASCATACLVILLWQVGDARLINHGKDHDGNLCGLENFTHTAFIYWPDLATDVKTNPTLALPKLYGVCVSECPQDGQVVEDYGTSQRASQWQVLQPTFPAFHRCMPYQKPKLATSTQLCARPGCQAVTGAPTKPEQVCGLAADGTNQFWLLEKPDSSIIDGWRAEGASEDLIQSRVSLAGSSGSSSCQQRVAREDTVSIKPLDDAVTYKLFTAITGPAFSYSHAVWENLGLVVGLGVGGAAVLSFAMMLMLPKCAPVLLLLLTILLFLLLIVADYILFVQANIATGRTGARFINFLKNLDISVPSEAESLLDHSSSKFNTEVFALAAFGVALLIAILACLVVSMSRKFGVLIGLFEEAGDMIRLTPSLLALPLLLLCSFACFFCILFSAAVALATASHDQLLPYLEKFGLGAGDETMKHFQQISGTSLAFVGIWIYFFHLSLYHCTVALTVSNTYFNGDLGEHRHLCSSLGGCCGAPVVVSLAIIFRYHLGSLSFGSLALTIGKVGQLALRWLDKHTEELTDHNLLSKGIKCITNCCVHAFTRCFRYLTEYAYIYTAITGQSFIPAAREALHLVCNYSLQVALNEIATWAVGFLIALAVPLVLAALAFLALRESFMTYLACACAVMVLAFLVTHMAMSVYDAIVTSIFVCAMRDEEYCGGQYMDRRLRRRLGFPESQHPHVEIPESLRFRS